MAQKIKFYTEDIQFKLMRKTLLRQWLETSALKEGYSISSLNIILCSDEHLLIINNQFLQHDYYTDIITFDYSKESSLIGELYISLERVLDNAQKNNVSPENELYRVIIHGVMHLCGYKDKTKKELKAMREKEEFYLQKIDKTKKGST
jgi:probable rRNA maturation factor